MSLNQYYSIFLVLLVLYACASEYDDSSNLITTQAKTVNALCTPSNQVQHRSSKVTIESMQKSIYGGIDPLENDPVVHSTIALFSDSDPDYQFALVDGSATLISPTVALGAAHTCELFKPQFASIGHQIPHEELLSFDEQIEQNPKGRLARIISCLSHPEYEKDAELPNDIALFYLSHQPQGSKTVAVIDPNSRLPHHVTIAGFGARTDQFSRWWEEIEAYRLQRVDSWISAVFKERLLFMDGPNPNHGSCQGDSGGPIYNRLPQSASSSGQKKSPIILLGSVVMGPACDEGIGFNSDLRHYIDWIAEQDAVYLELQSVPVDEKDDANIQMIDCTQ